MRKLLKKKWIVMFALLLAVLAFPGKADAASKITKMESGKTYTRKLDGKAHTVKYVYDEGGYAGKPTVKLYIDGILKKQISDYVYYTAWMVKVGPKKTFLCIHNEGPSDDTIFFKVYKYKKGRLKEIGDLAGVVRPGFSDRLAYANILSVKKDKWTVKWRLQSSTLGSMTNIKMTYKVTSSGIKRMGKEYTLRSWNSYSGKDAPCSNWTAKQDIGVYKTKRGRKVSFYIRKGEKVDILKMSGKNGTTWFKVRSSNGKTGWYKEPKVGSSVYGYFEECMFAG